MDTPIKINRIESFYQAFLDVSRAVHSSTRLQKVLNLVVRKYCEVLDAKGAILRLLNLDNHKFEAFAACGVGENYLPLNPVTGEDIITDLCRKNKVVIIKDILNSPRVSYPEQKWQDGVRLVFDVPLIMRDSIIGIIRIYFGENRRFDHDEINFVVALAEQCSLAIESARQFETQRSHYLAMALENEKMVSLGRMAAGIAHEINNPLAGILLYSSNLVKKVPDGSPLKEGLEIIVNETIRCRGIIQELLDFSRRGEPKKVLADINDVIKKALSILENEFKLNHVYLESYFGKDIPFLMVDPGQMRQVFINILLNAVQAIGRHGVIVIRTWLESANGKVLIEISDNGPGIPLEHRDKIFEPFFSTKSSGTGLGLAVTYRIIRNHGGTIKAISTKDKGTCFRIELPESSFATEAGIEREGAA